MLSMLHSASEKRAPPAPHAAGGEACAPRATRLAAAGARAAAQAALPRLFELPWPALRRILTALPPTQRVAIGAVCKPLLAASKHPEGAPPARSAQGAKTRRCRACSCCGGIERRVLLARACAAAPYAHRRDGAARRNIGRAAQRAARADR
jgi:hypothetical protein